MMQTYIKEFETAFKEGNELKKTVELGSRFVRRHHNLIVLGGGVRVDKFAFPLDKKNDQIDMLVQSDLERRQRFCYAVAFPTYITFCARLNHVVLREFNHL